MSDTEDRVDRPDRAALSELESAVGVLLERVAESTSRAVESEERSEELGEIVKRFTGDEAEAGRLLSKLRALEEENADLKERLQLGRAGVDRLLAKIRFLEEHE